MRVSRVGQRTDLSKSFTNYVLFYFNFLAFLIFLKTISGKTVIVINSSIEETSILCLLGEYMNSMIDV